MNINQVIILYAIWLQKSEESVHFELDRIIYYIWNEHKGNNAMLEFDDDIG